MATDEVERFGSEGVAEHSLTRDPYEHAWAGRGFSRPGPAAEPDPELTEAQRAAAAAYSSNYLRGQADAWNGMHARPDGGEQAAAGYAAGHRWGSRHPAPSGRQRGPGHEAEAG